MLPVLVQKNDTEKNVISVQKMKKKEWYKHANPDYFAKEEIKIILEELYDNPYYEVLFLFIYETAARQSEALKVKIKDIDFSLKMAGVPTSKQRHSEAPMRNCPISKNLITLILDHIKKNNLKPTDFLFARKTGGKPVSRVSVYKKFRKLVTETLGIDYKKKAHPHSLRHSRAVHMLTYSKQMNIGIVKRVLGHSNINNTMIYLRFADQEINNAMADVNDNMGLFN